MSTPPPLLVPPIDYPTAVNQTVQFEKCQGGTGNHFVPMEKLREVVPEDFLLDAALGLPRMGQVSIIAIYCERAIVNATVLNDVAMLRTAVFVTPKNQSWQDDAVHHYLLDTWFSLPELAAWFAPTGTPSAAATITRDSVPGQTSPRKELWNVDGLDCDTRTEFNQFGQNAPPDENPFIYWFGQKPYGRIDVFERAVYDDPFSGSSYVVEGQCTTQRVLSDSPTYGSHFTSSYNATWTITGELFG